MSDDPRDAVWRWRMDSAGKPTVEAKLPVAGWCRVCWCDCEYIAERIVDEHNRIGRVLSNAILVLKSAVDACG